MVYIAYLLITIVVVLFSIKAADYVDLIDKKTNISGAFIGGVMLAAITSLPELFTSISGVLIFDNPELVLGNILGSNIFNLATMSFVLLFFLNKFKDSVISKNHFKTTIFLVIITFILFIPVYFGRDFKIFNISIVSILILVFYFMSLRFMANDDSDELNNEDDCKLKMNQIVTRFILSSVGLVIASILLTYVTDIISEKLNLAASLSGALFLGIATSLPEVTSVIALAKKLRFNLVVGNIVGSNMFNLFIISITDFIYIGNSVYLTKQIQTKYLLLFCFISTVVIFFMLGFKNIKKSNKIIYLALSILMIVSYLIYLILSL